MPAAPRHAKRKGPAIRLGAVAVAAASLAGVAAAFVFLSGVSAAPRPVAGAIPVTSAAAGFTRPQTVTAVHSAAAAMEARAVQRTARLKHLAAARLARQRLARQRAARQQARQQARQAATAPPSPAPAATPAPTPTPTPTPSSGGGDAAHSPLGVCIRNAEEGGSYAWGPGNGGGAYQFQIGTWETYGGAASEYGVGQAPPTRIRYSTTPSPQAARRTGRHTTAADRPRARRGRPRQEDRLLTGPPGPVPPVSAAAFPPPGQRAHGRGGTGSDRRHRSALIRAAVPVFR